MASNTLVMKKIKATAHYVDVVAISGLYNGYVAVLGAKGSDGTYTIAANGAVTDEGFCVIVDEGLSYEAEKTIDSRVFTVGEILRAVLPELGDIIDIPVANVTATAALQVGRVIVPKGTALPMECLASFAGTEVLGFSIEKLYTKNGISMVSMRCTRTQK
jgi:hypothetical protein